MAKPCSASHGKYSACDDRFSVLIRFTSCTVCITLGPLPWAAAVPWCLHFILIVPMVEHDASKTFREGCFHLRFYSQGAQVSGEGEICLKL